MEDSAILVKRFCEALSVPVDETVDLDAKLSDLARSARAAWPTVSLDPARFVSHLARHAGEAPLAYLDAVHAADLYLACAALDHDKSALERFEAEFIAKVRDYVVRVTVERELVDEVQQTLRERLLLGPAPKLGEYAGRGPLGGWVRVAAVRTALNLLRGRTSGSDLPDDEPALAHDPELAFAKAGAQALFREAFVSVMAGLDAEQRTMLRLHYVDGLTLDQLTKMYRRPRSTLARWIDQIRKDILAATEARLRAGRLSPSEVASVLHGAASQFHLTLTKILK